jgi:hypothetical protein
MGPQLAPNLLRMAVSMNMNPVERQTARQEPQKFTITPNRSRGPSWLILSSTTQARHPFSCKLM